MEQKHGYWLISSHLDEDPVLTMMDAVTNKAADAAGVNLHTCPLHTDKEQHNQSADQRTATHRRTLGHRLVFY